MAQVLEHLLCKHQAPQKKKKYNQLISGTNETWLNDWSRIAL
jgi:hypothetical protein